MTKLRTVAALVGLILSTYAVYVEYKMASIHSNKVAKEEAALAAAKLAAESSSSSEDGTVTTNTIPSFIETEEEFVALCDIKALGASCSTVFTLPEGRMLSYFGIIPEHSILDLPNAALGMIHYTYLLILQPFMPKSITKFMIFLAFASTVFLAYQLTFVLFELCILCWSTHVINTYNFYSYYFTTKSSSSSGTSSSTKTKKKSE